jgi:hypothetical protein
MGKRELLLVFCFVVVGAVVYQATARPPAPGERGLSLSRFIESARRGIRGNRASAETTATTNHALTPELNELRVTGQISDVEVVGEERQDVESTTHVESNGYDEAEARGYLKESKLVPDRTASSLILRMEFPRGGRQRGTLKVKVPSRFRVRIEPGSAAVKISSVAEVEIAGTRGEVAVQRISGKVEITHRGGEVEIEDVGALEFTGRAGALKIAGVRGDASIKMEQGGEMTVSRLTGALDLDARNCDIGLEDLSNARGPIRVNLNGGSLKAKGLKSETRVDSRGAEIEIAMAGPAQVAIYSEGERVTLTPPPGSYTLDARIIDGRLTSRDVVDKLGFSTNETGSERKEAHVFGPFKGGGPTISVRATHADFAIEEPGHTAGPEGQAPVTKPRLKSTLK